MQIAWLDQNQQCQIPMRIFYHFMQEEIAKIADVTFYGAGGGKFIPEFDVSKIAKEKPDIIVFWSNQLSFINTDKTNIPKYCKCGEPHGVNFARHIGFLTRNKIKLASLEVWEKSLFEYQRVCPDTHFFPMPLSLPHQIFVNKGYERQWDCFFIGSYGIECYPLRAKIIERLKKNPKIKFYFAPLRSRIVTPEQWNVELNRYIELLNQTKIIPFSNSIFNYPVSRWHEGMACGCLVLAEIPKDTSLLHFVPHVNFVPIDEEHFEKQILYYLEHENERLKIVNDAKETFLKYNTVEIRAKQLLNHLEEFLNGR